MSQFFQIHVENPQPRLIKQAARIIEEGGVVIYPTDTTYALACCIGNKAGIDRIRQIRQLDEKHNFTLICRDLSDLGIYAKVNTSAFRLLKTYTPGPYTFILEATREVPRMLMHPKRRTIGLRVPNFPITQALLAEVTKPLLTTSLIMPDESQPMTDPYEIRDLLENRVDLIIDGGMGNLEVSTVISLVDDTPEVIREGLGDPKPFQ
ncbi:L-threonylcarbamoyladenylate synthase [Entomomonas asaccharolytica]|uniref:Threonylcarbamoyl-AMP synthase n=1 Tax=Entomomonas asaccharolytica TaxID=2785331 RepID=A0A974NFG6_9GAMM|nr:L-threonylcarbamoyladenylate synthase [Entomomonas asaccharolytica]QQP85708.1 threonylcarbamoyl-AMP synthase [Entomomonas asaccharolytica]